MDKLVIPVPKPRNPFVAAAKFRRAGSAYRTKREMLARIERRDERRELRNQDEDNR